MYIWVLDSFFRGLLHRQASRCSSLRRTYRLTYTRQRTVGKMNIFFLTLFWLWVNQRMFYPSINSSVATLRVTNDTSALCFLPTGDIDHSHFLQTDIVILVSFPQAEWVTKLLFRSVALQSNNAMIVIARYQRTLAVGVVIALLTILEIQHDVATI